MPCRRTHGPGTGRGERERERERGRETKKNKIIIKIILTTSDLKASSPKMKTTSQEEE